MSKKITNTLIIFLCSFSVAHLTHAASLSIEPSNHAGTFDVFINTENNESFNALEGSILFNENLPVAPHLQTGDSIISSWIGSSPVLSGNSISFSGVIPGGFSGEYDQFTGKQTHKGKLFSVSFPYESNTSSLTFIPDGVVLYTNDGKGTPIPLGSHTFNFPVAADKTASVSPTDVTPPEPFEASIESTKNIFNGNYFLVFQTTDGESGIDSYFVKENDGSWVYATSPYELTVQDLTHTISVKAVDRLGNSRIATITIHALPRHKTNGIYLIILSALALLTIWIIRKIHRHLFKKSNENVS